MAFHRAVSPAEGNLCGGIPNWPQAFVDRHETVVLYYHETGFLHTVRKEEISVKTKDVPVIFLLCFLLTLGGDQNAGSVF